MNNEIRLFIRRALNVHEFETISDAINRKKYKFLKKINHNSFTADDLKNKLVLLGLKKGDTVIVHSSWRAFIGYKGTPKSVIDILLEIVGKDGTIIMPSYTTNKENFDYNDASSAGYISEVFRTNYPSIRSLNSVFSMCALGKKADIVTKSHINSIYAFDKNSPYYISINNNNTKILLLGLGKHPHKITLFHCITYNLKNRINIYKNVYTEKKKVTIVDKEGNLIKKNIIDRVPNKQNSKRKFRKLFSKVISEENYGKINFLDIYLFDGKNIYDSAEKYILKHNYNLYRK